MRYWDSSALAALVVEERHTPTLRNAFVQAPAVTWCLSDVEIISAIERRARERSLDEDGRPRALVRLGVLAGSWTEVAAVDAVRERAERLLATHALRAADALQLAAALVAARDRPRGHDFVCRDERLCDAARREGFTIVSH